MSDRELTPKQAKFLSEYLKDFNGTQAAIRAEYSEDTAAEQACRLLRNVNIKQRVLKEFEKHGSVIQRVLAEYFKIATSNIKDYVIVSPGGGIEAIPFEDIERHDAGAIKKIREKRIIRQTKDKSGDILLDDTIEYELYDKTKALEAISKIAKLVTNNIDLTSGGEKIPQAQFVVYKKGDE